MPESPPGLNKPLKIAQRGEGEGGLVPFFLCPRASNCMFFYYGIGVGVHEIRQVKTPWKIFIFDKKKQGFCQNLCPNAIRILHEFCPEFARIKGFPGQFQTFSNQFNVSSNQFRANCDRALVTQNQQLSDQFAIAPMNLTQWAMVFVNRNSNSSIVIQIRPFVTFPSLRPFNSLMGIHIWNNCNQIKNNWGSFQVENQNEEGFGKR